MRESPFATQRSKCGKPILTGATPIPAIPIAPLDPNFEGSAVLTTDSEGRYRFKTIKPAAYPAGPNRMRPAHIHFQVSGRQDKIVTQMYFEGDPYNKTDPFLNSAGEAGRQELLVRKLLDPSPDLEPDSKMMIFDIVLYKG